MMKRFNWKKNIALNHLTKWPSSRFCSKIHRDDKFGNLIRVRNWFKPQVSIAHIYLDVKTDEWDETNFKLKYTANKFAVLDREMCLSKRWKKFDIVIQREFVQISLISKCKTAKFDESYSHNNVVISSLRNNRYRIMKCFDHYSITKSL